MGTRRSLAMSIVACACACRAPAPPQTPEPQLALAQPRVWQTFTSNPFPADFRIHGSTLDRPIVVRGDQIWVEPNNSWGVGPDSFVLDTKTLIWSRRPISSFQ